MKKTIITIAIAVLALASCTKENFNGVSKQNDSFTLTAAAPGSENTKTSLSPGAGNNWNVLWSDGDALKVKVSGDGTSSSDYAEYTLESGSGTGSAVFRGTVEAPDEVFAFYPSSLTREINSYGMFFDIPTSQNYSASGEVSNNSLPMYAKGSKGSLSFNHICSVIRIPVWVNQADLKLNYVGVISDKKIFGVWYFGVSKGFDIARPSTGINGNVCSFECHNLTVSNDASSPTVLNIITGVNEHSCGNLTFEFVFSDGSSFLKSTSSLTADIECGKIYKLPVLELQKTSSDMQINIDGGGWNSWDGTSDISAPTTSVAVKGTNSSLSKASLETILAKIKAGTNLIDLDLGSIKASSNLATIEIEESLFKSNKKIKNVILPEGVNSIEEKAFTGSSVHCITIPDSMASIGGNFAAGCASVSFAAKPSNPKYCVIDGCIYEKKGTNPETYSLALIPYPMKSIIIAENTTIILDRAMVYCHNLQNLTIPATVTKIGLQSTGVTRDLANITILCETPPAITIKNGTHWGYVGYHAGYGVTGAKTITVPVGCLEAYTGTEGNRTDWWNQFHVIAGYEFTEGSTPITGTSASLSPLSQNNDFGSMDFWK